MSTHAERNLAAPLVIALAVAGGGALVLTAPLREKLEAARERTVQAQSLLARTTPLMANAPRWRELADNAERDLREIMERSALASEPAALHRTIHELAGRSRVRIDRHQAREERPAAAPKPGDPTVALRCSIEAIGGYAELAEWIGALGSLGHGRIDSVRLRPADGAESDMVTAVVESTHWSFEPLASEPAATVQTVEVSP